jgi:hypothetical protein
MSDSPTKQRALGGNRTSINTHSYSTRLLSATALAPLVHPLFELVHSQEHPYDQNIYAQLHGSRVVEGGNRISAGIIRGPGDTWMLDDVVDGDDMGEILLHIRAGDSAK